MASFDVSTTKGMGPFHCLRRLGEAKNDDDIITCLRN